jgi:hypothetical protein
LCPTRTERRHQLPRWDGQQVEYEIPCMEENQGLREISNGDPLVSRLIWSAVRALVCGI